MNFSPIVLFAYNRLLSLKETVSALQENELAPKSSLIIYSDGPKKKGDSNAVNEIRKYLRTIRRFENVSIIESEENKGLADSIIKGVTHCIQEYGKVIVLEDDIVVSRNFLNYMNEALEYYKNNPQIFSISGYSVPIQKKNDESSDIYVTNRISSWGWATWKDRWEKVDWNINGYDEIKTDKIKEKMIRAAGPDLVRMLKKQSEGKIDSWAIRWCYHQAVRNLQTVYPMISKTKNVGFGETATHTKRHYNRFETLLDDSGKKEFIFPEKTEPDNYYIRQFNKPFGLRKRIFDRIRNEFARIKQ